MNRLKNLEEAIALANDTIYGLGGYLFCDPSNQDGFAVSQKLKTGNVSINGANYAIPEDPFGGYKKSGIGKEHGKLGLRSLCQARLIAQMKK